MKHMLGVLRTLSMKGSYVDGFLLYHPFSEDSDRKSFPSDA